MQSVCFYTRSVCCHLGKMTLTKRRRTQAVEGPGTACLGEGTTTTNDRARETHNPAHCGLHPSAAKCGIKPLGHQHTGAWGWGWSLRLGRSLGITTQERGAGGGAWGCLSSAYTPSHLSCDPPRPWPPPLLPADAALTTTGSARVPHAGGPPGTTCLPRPPVSTRRLGA